MTSWTETGGRQRNLFYPVYGVDVACVVDVAGAASVAAGRLRKKRLKRATNLIGASNNNATKI